jgi:formate dehydrogenase-N alpha subunit
MTNHWNDIKNADVILAMGCNPAGNHPISFRWITEAMERGATLISADPRFTRTSAKADIYAPLRPGSDIALLSGMINYILENDLYHEEYVREHTNASLLINPDFAFNDGLFSGYGADKRKYDPSTWAYQTDEAGIPKRDPTMQDPDCVFQLLRTHFSRYDPDTVSSITGTPKENVLKVYQTYATTGAPDKVGTIMYAMGWTQHTVGTQNIRAAAIIQLLLGNVGRAGGGINALRGESNVQGSTDHCLLFHILPGYLKMPIATDETLEKYLKRTTPESSDPESANWWQHTPKYMVSLLKAWYGENATQENEFGYQWLPKNGGNYSWLNLFKTMSENGIKGLLIFGQNPAVSSASAGVAQAAFHSLDWMVSVNLWSTETANFWQRPGADPTGIKTEVFMLPAAASFEKQGSITNSGRWAQWRWKAIEPPGEARPDSWIINQLLLRLRKLYENEGGPNAEAITHLAWDYGSDEPDIEIVAKEINGYYTTDVTDENGQVIGKKGEQVKNFTALKDDGSTASSNWLYSGAWTPDGNMMARRESQDTHPAGIGLYSKWAWCWPVNRRIIYNRASVDLTGKPFDSERWVIRWDPSAKDGNGDWVGDVPDGGWPPGARHPFIMKPEGFARIFGMGLADGPFPEHYEPWESPVENILHPAVDINPACTIYPEAINPRGAADKYPVVATTHRISEHWQTGAMTRHQPWLLELQPEMFVTLSQELAAQHGIENGERIFVESARTRIETVAYVTDRMPVLTVNGRKVHVIAMPWHWGFMGPETPGGYGSGDSANLLTVFMGDANTMIPESKAFLCRIGKV